MTYLISLDQGTTSTRAILFDQKSHLINTHQIELKQSFPQDGWVEHDASIIWHDAISCIQQVMTKAQLTAQDITAIGISNQRETTVLWDKATGEPIAPAIVWQDRRTAQYCADMAQDQSLMDAIAQKTGLLLDPYFSATKIKWLLDHIPDARTKASQGKILFGTIECYLLWRLTDGKSHISDITNASRTMLFNIHTRQWDTELLDLFDIPPHILPEVSPNVAQFGQSNPDLLGGSIAICGMAGDQQAATIGQACFKTGMAKTTYGTGCFMLVNTGDKPVVSQNRLLTTIAYHVHDQLAYGLEGSIFVAGAAIQWLRDGLGLLADAAQSEQMAASVHDTGGAYLVPAFTGLGAPYWDAMARGGLVGLTRDTNQAHIVRAALESVAYQTRDLLNAMQKDGVVSFSSLRIDGGMANNSWFVQFLSDTLQLPIQKPHCVETSALGAAYLAGLGCGLFKDLDEISAMWSLDHEQTPKMHVSLTQKLYDGWSMAVKRVRSNM